MIGGFYLLKKLHYFIGAKLFLIAGSLFFYGYWKISYLPILLFSIVANYGIASLIQNSSQSNTSIGGGVEEKLF